jgi:hypothetical protein
MTAGAFGTSKAAIGCVIAVSVAAPALAEHTSAELLMSVDRGEAATLGIKP